MPLGMRSPTISCMPAIPTVPINRDALRALRLASGMSQRQLATAAGTVQSHISDIENGQAPSELTANRIARALNVPTAAILRDGPSMEGGVA